MTNLIEYVDALTGVGNLDKNQGKILLHYCIMTWSDEPKFRAIIDIHGESGTGKSSIMHQIQDWCREPRWIVARNMTSATLRDQLADKITVFVEEADKTKNQKDAENLYQNRYDIEGARIPYKRMQLIGGKRLFAPDEIHCFYGYTILHTQNQIQAQEMSRRTIQISLIKDSNKLYESTDGLSGHVLAKIANEIDWNSEIEKEYSGSAYDAWLPIIRVARHLDDEEFIEYVKEQVMLKREVDDTSKVFEPKGLVLSEIWDIYANQKLGNLDIPLTEIRNGLKYRDYTIMERQISREAQGLGFRIIYKRNKGHIQISCLDELNSILVKNGYEPDSEDKQTTSEIVTDISEDVNKFLKSKRLLPTIH